jgi:hypothetical protein
MAEDSPTKKSAPKKTAPRKSAAPKAEPARRPSGRQLAVGAAEQLVELTGKEFEGIVGLVRTDDGWAVQVEVLELRRIPSTTDVLAVYEVGLDDSGELTEYRRVHRYVRGEAREDRHE